VDAPRTRVRLRVSPGSRTPGIVGRHGEAWKVHVGAAAENGRANEAVVRLLADALAVPRSRVTLVSGRATRDKVIELTGVTRDETERRLDAVRKDGAS